MPKRTRSPIGYQLVVIGASAGGVDALSTVVAALPEGFPLPVVIAQHLDPKRQSNLGEILGRHARLPVRTVADRNSLVSGTVYVVPAGRHVEIDDHGIRLRLARGPGPKPSVNRLLSTAAGVFGDKLIAVILTGSGSDGSAGARDVKLAGGTVVIQDPKTASYPSMPRSLAPTSIDFVSDLEEVGPLLVRLTEGARPHEPSGEDSQLELFLDRLRQESGIDFNTYKRPTIMRRLQRRMAASGQPTLKAYGRYVEKHPDEFRQLTASFLINVTEFFRDPALFEYLRGEVLPRLISDARAAGRELRLWSAGCSTGEETYSLAILVSELLGDELDQFDVRIFATDVDTDGIAFARRATYPEAALAKIPEELRAKYFVGTDGELEVVKRIRQLTIFGQHDLGVRAPFPRIDLILCRNVLIYFTSELQRRALQVFAFSLRKGGRLVLGSSESVSALAEYFVTEQMRLKVFRREGGPKLIAPLALARVSGLPGQRRSASGLDTAVTTTRQERDRSRTIAERAARIIQDLPFGVVSLDSHYDIEDINVAARRLLGIHGTAIGEDFVHQAEVLPASPLRSEIDAALRGETRRVVLPVATPDRLPSAERHLELLIRPVRATQGASPHGVLIGIRDATAEFAAEDRLADLARQLEHAAEAERRLLAANEDVTAANAALRVSNEEFLLSNEESQSAREEIETLNEELQATNEELETLNEELQASVEELNIANEDLQVRTQEVQTQAGTLHEERSRLASILASMGDGVLAVDRAGQPVMVNAAFERMFPQRADFQPEDDDGRPLPMAAQPRHRAAAGEAFSTNFTITGPDGSRRWFEGSAQPLEGEDGRWGGVLVVRDITDRSLRHLQERFMGAASHELRTPLAALQGFVQLALRRLAAGKPDESADYIAEALGQTRNLARLVGRLFDVAAIESGRLSLDMKPIDLVPVVRQAVDVTQVLEDTLRVDAQFAVSTLPVLADRTRIDQVLFNLISNAFTHAAQGGGVMIRVGAEDGSARIDVEDRGPGIPAERLDRLFERFAAAQQSPRSAGLGLGLFLSREIIQAHGGSITAQSTVGAGTTIIVKVPLRERPPKSRATNGRARSAAVTKRRRP